jgi:threonine dehydratase
MISFPKDVGGAHERSKSHLRHTPLEHSPYLSNLIDDDVYLKLDNIQETGSFKFRGAISKMILFPGYCPVSNKHHHQ